MKRLTFFQSLMWIVLSTLVVTPSIYTGIRFFQKMRARHLTSPSYQIRSIVQTSSIRRALNTAFFAERLGLAVDLVQNIYEFDRALGEQELLKSAVIKAVQIKKQYPDTLYIDYEMRIPLVKIGDYQNVALDEEKIVFPIIPFFKARKVPEIYLGEGGEEVLYNKVLRHPKIDFALDLLHVLEEVFKEESLIIERIDVANLFACSYGRREVIVVVKGHKGRHFLRLQTKEFEKQIANYLSLKKVLDQEGCKERVVDLRIDNLAYIDEVTNG
jgi:hypothetical protein